MNEVFFEARDQQSKMNIPLQNCPNCGISIRAISGSRDSVCKNCGYKDPCCE